MPYKYRIIIVVGARPQIMKAAALAKALDNFPDIEYLIVHSGQHYDDNMSTNFFLEFNLKEPDYNFEIGSKTHNIFIAEFLLKFDPVLESEKPNMVVVVGDTNTTAAAAIATAKRNIALAHVEAGLREWDKSIPEEVNKLITDSISDLYFCPTQTGIDNLVRQGVSKKVYLTGDITLDLLYDASFIWTEQKTKSTFKLQQKYILVTCHREINNEKNALISIVAALNKLSDYTIIWPIHPRTKKSIASLKLESTISEHIQIIEPTSYQETQSLIKYADFSITDSGGIIKESYFHKTPTIIIDNQTEWVETVQEKWSIVCGPNTDKILDSIENFKIPKSHKNALGDGMAGIRIAKTIFKYLEQH